MNILNFLFIFLAAIGLIFCRHQVNASEKLKPVTIQLKWYHQFQFSG